MVVPNVQTLRFILSNTQAWSLPTNWQSTTTMKLLANNGSISTPYGDCERGVQAWVCTDVSFLTWRFSRIAPALVKTLSHKQMLISTLSAYLLSGTWSTLHCLKWLGSAWYNNFTCHLSRRSWRYLRVLRNGITVMTKFNGRKSTAEWRW
jgi:hypothetical protein